MRLALLTLHEEHTTNGIVDHRDGEIALIELLAHAAIDIITIGSAWVCPVLTLGSDIVITERSLEFQVFNKFKLSINGIECTGDILTLAVILISECRVAVTDTDECAIPCAILIIDGVGWCHSTSRRIEGSSIGKTFTIHILINTGEEDIGTERQPVGRLIIHIETTSQTFQTRTVGDTVLLQIGDRRVILKLVGTTRNRCFILLMTAFFEKYIVPIDKATPRNRRIVIDIVISIDSGFLLGLSLENLTGIKTIINNVSSTNIL